MDSERIRVLVVDDEPYMLELFDAVLSEKGYDVWTTGNGHEAAGIVQSNDIDVVISDIKMPDTTGIQVLESIRRFSNDVAVVLMTGYATIETAIEALRLGADDYLLKPFEDFEGTVVGVLRRVTERKRLKKENERLSGELKEANTRLRTSNSDMKRMMAQLTTLQQINQMINGCTDAETILEVLSDCLTTGLDVEKFVVTISDGGNWYQAARWSGVSSEDARNFSYAPGEGMIGEAVSSHIPTFVSIPGTDGECSSGTLVLPLLAGGEDMGALFIISLRGSDEIDKNHVDLFSIIASQISAPLALVTCRDAGNRQPA